MILNLISQRLLRLFTLLLIANVLSSDDVFAKESAKKVLLVMVDGISAEQLKRVNTPNLDAIARVGGYTRAYVGGEVKSYSQTPTISAVGYNSMLTGTWVNKHNVWDNAIKEPNYNYWTLFRLLKETYPHKTTAIYSTWLDNRTKLLGENLASTNKLRVDYVVDGMEVDTVRFPNDTDSKRIHLIDELVVKQAASGIVTDAPDLSWVYLQYTDDMGHKFGNGDPFYAAVGIMDKQIGKLWEAVQTRSKETGEEWQVYITTDHGRREEDGKSHGGQTAGERSTWIVTNAKGLNTYFKGTVGDEYIPAIVDIFPSVVRFMNLRLSQQQRFEVDGIPLLGPLSVVNLKVISKDLKNTQITWKPVEKKGTLKIWLATTNHFETGGLDVYHLIDEVDTQNGSYSLDLLKYPSSIYKIVVEGTHNTLNKWVVRSE